MKSLVGALITALFAILSGAWAQSSPMIMERADSLAVSQRGGHLVLKGNVRFRHDSLQFFTERAVWNRGTDRVQCEGGFRFLHPDGSIEAKSGSYGRSDETARALGAVVARDSSGEMSFFGEELIFERRKGFLTLPQKPVIHRYYKDSTGTRNKDTLAIRARRITYDQKNEVATAIDSVVLTRDDLVVTTDTGVFDRANNVLRLWGNPVCRMRSYTLRGDSMVIRLDGESLKSILVLRNAWGSQDEPAKEGKPGMHTEVEGDSLYAEFSGKRIHRMRASGNAVGSFFEADLKNYVNQLVGDSLTIDFSDGQMEVARARGTASSRYHYVKNDRTVQGVNESVGDSIRIEFRDNKVARLHIRGNSSTGVYQDLKRKDGSPLGSGAADTTADGKPKPPVAAQGERPREQGATEVRPARERSLTGTPDAGAVTPAASTKKKRAKSKSSAPARPATPTQEKK